MALSLENDNAPKASDKSDKTKVESITTNSQDLEVTNSGSNNKEAPVSTLNDVQLKALLDEAKNYKRPKDSENKSILFQTGVQTHGGSLNNLAKEDLFAATNYTPKLTKSVSTQERQGGSLPCNVNAGITHDEQFFEEVCKKKEIKKEYSLINMESKNLLEHDLLNQNRTEQSDIEVTKHNLPSNNQKYTTSFNLEIGSAADHPSNVRSIERTADRITENDSTFKQFENITATSQHYPSSQYSVVMPSLSGPLWTFSRKTMEDNKKIDENGNALAAAAAAAASRAKHLDSKKNKKKKIQTDKNVVVLKAKDVAGHRSDIIDDLDKLVEYIRGDEEQPGTKSKSNVHKTKFDKRNFSGDDKTSNHKKQQTRTKAKTEKIQKSNFMEEIPEAPVSTLNDVQLKALLDEAKNYKTPKDHEGKSVLYQVGVQTHGRSLNNLTKEELFAATNYTPKLTKPVNTQECQGGSLPCNVNTGITQDKQFFEEACKVKEIKQEYTAIDMESKNILEHDHLSQNHTEQSDMEVTKHDLPSNNEKYTSRFNLEIDSAADHSSNVRALESSADRITEHDSTFKQLENITATSQHYQSSQYSMVMPSLTGPLWTFSRKTMEDNKKMDGNALAAAAAVAASHAKSLNSKKNKKKKIQTDKNVVVLEAKDVAGHRSDIIHDLDKLVEYIRGDEEQPGTKSKSNIHQTKFHKHNFSGDDKTSDHKNKQTRTKGKIEKNQKSNSMK